MRKTDTKDVREFAKSFLYLKEVGTGTPVVLIPGFGESSEIWDSMIPFLSRRYRLLLPDLPGFGKSPSMAQGSFSITDIAKLLLNTLKNREISSTIVIGHSLGGYVAAAIARIDPGFLYGLGFFHSTACADSPERSILRDSTVQFLKRRGSEAFAKSFVPQQFAKEGWKKNIASIEKSIAMVSSCADSSLIAYTKAMKNRRDELLTIGKLNIPLLMISGEKDALVTADQNREEMKFYKRPHIYFLENSAHMGMFEDTAKCNTIIDEFVGCCNPTGK